MVRVCGAVRRWLALHWDRKDVIRRFQQHNDGTASRYTRSRLPVRLVYQESVANQSLALKREAALKALSRREKLALIRLRKKAG